MTGVVGVVSSSNSLVGSSKGDAVGAESVTTLSNGNYVVESSEWNGGTGASTWGNGSKGVRGVVSAANSFVGSANGDYVGNVSGGCVPLSNGNYLILSPNWNHRKGAATWVNGKTGIVDTINAANSLVGSSTGDLVGESYTLLANGNYLIVSPYWNGSRGAVTLGGAAHGTVGVVSVSNSLVGSTAGDYVGGSYVYALPNGNYVVDSPSWSYGLGAVTLGNGVTGVTGQVNAADSLVGSSTNDSVGSNGIRVLSNSNYIVTSIHWTNATVKDAGAVTFGNGITGVHGSVSAANSLVGSSTNDQIGDAGIYEFSNNNYLVISPNWSRVSGNSNGGGFVIPNAGAVTFGSGTTGVSGLITTANSFVGPGPLLTTPSTPFPLPNYYYYYYPQVIFDNADQTFAVTFGGQGAIVVGSQTSGIPAPTLTLFAVDPLAAKYATNSSGTPVAPTIQIVNNAGNLLSATIQITGNYRNGQDQLVFKNTSKITGIWNASTGTLTLTGQGSAADYATALASVNYRNLSKTPNRLTRTVSLTTADGQNVSNTVARKISFS